MTNNLRAIRLASGMTQLDLAILLRVAPIRISEWERGIVEPRVRTAVRLAKTLHCQVEDIWTQ